MKYRKEQRSLWEDEARPAVVARTGVVYEAPAVERRFSGWAAAGDERLTVYVSEGFLWDQIAERSRRAAERIRDG